MPTTCLTVILMKSTKTLFVLLACYALYYLLPLEFRLLWQPDETRYAEISRELLAAGNWVDPHFLGVRYFEKPIAGYWINNLSQLLFGHNNFAVRFGSVFSVTLSALMVVWLAKRIWKDNATAVMSGVIFLTCFLVYGIGTYAVLDPMITLWLTAAMCSFWVASEAQTTRGKIGGYLLLGLACGMGVMTKGFLALAVPVIGVLPWVAVHKRWKEVLLFGPLAVISATLITLPWALAVARLEPDFWHYFFWVEHIQRFAESNAQHKAPFWYYLPFLLAGTLPWLAYLPGALKSGWVKRHSHSGAVYLLGWVVMPILFFSIAKGKLPTYILPCFAPLAILLSHYAQAAGSGIRRLNGWINIGFGCVCTLAVLFVLAPFGLAKHPLYQTTELFKVFCAVLAFVCWAVVGWVSSRGWQPRWQLAALCPLGLALLVGAAIPDQIIDSKQPQAFVENVQGELAGSRYILSNNVGTASAIAWALKRSDINMYGSPGELAYGMSYPDARGKLVPTAEFPTWLSKHRQQGNVALVLLLSRHGVVDEHEVPKPDAIVHQGRFVLYLYHQK